jgi:D-aminoacyl-tRNA deacylase
MIGLIQRVTGASVSIDGEKVAAIGAGLLALVCAERDDTAREPDLLLARILGYRVFADDSGRMNRSLVDVGGELLIVPQFTLAADTKNGTRPSFAPAAAPEPGRRLYEQFVASARTRHPRVACGVFGAAMQVALVNDGPVTFWLRVP